MRNGTSHRPGLSRSLVAGALGAATLTALNEGGRRVIRAAPRAEILGERGVQKTARLLGRRLRGPALYRTALASDLASNALWYALAGRADRPLRAGLLLGGLAGLGAVLLPGLLGLGTAPTRRTRRTAALTVSWYTVGGLVAGLLLARSRGAR